MRPAPKAGPSSQPEEALTHLVLLSSTSPPEQSRPRFSADARGRPTSTKGSPSPAERGEAATPPQGLSCQ